MSLKARIGVVGPCAAGKTTLITGLKEHGYAASHIAQDHSEVPDMWRRLSDPDLLIFLDVSFEKSLERRHMDWTLAEFAHQQERLAHARRHADLMIDTDALPREEVLDQVLEFLNRQSIESGV